MSKPKKEISAADRVRIAHERSVDDAPETDDEKALKIFVLIVGVLSAALGLYITSAVTVFPPAGFFVLHAFGGAAAALASSSAPSNRTPLSQWSIVMTIWGVLILVLFVFLLIYSGA